MYNNMQFFFKLYIFAKQIMCNFVLDTYNTRSIRRKNINKKCCTKKSRCDRFLCCLQRGTVDCVSKTERHCTSKTVTIHDGQRPSFRLKLNQSSK